MTPIRRLDRKIGYRLKRRFFPYFYVNVYVYMHYIHSQVDIHTHTHITTPTHASTRIHSRPHTTLRYKCVSQKLNPLSDAPHLASEDEHTRSFGLNVLTATEMNEQCTLEMDSSSDFFTHNVMSVLQIQSFFIHVGNIPLSNDLSLTASSSFLHFNLTLVNN